MKERYVVSYLHLQWKYSERLVRLAESSIWRS